MRNHLVCILMVLPYYGLSQLCYPDRHNTSWNQSWISCEKRDNPNAERGNSHWILYDFGNTYRLGDVKLWNINAPEYLNSGIKDFYIDYSQDGFNWNTLGQFTLAQASGKSIYEGEDITTFSGDTARFILITALDNWGGSCAGLSEVKFNIVELVRELHSYRTEKCLEVSVYPNPHQEEFTLSISSWCEGDIHYSLYDHTGKQVKAGEIGPDNRIFLSRIQTADLSSGLYHLVLRQNETVASYPVMKM